MDVCKLCPGEKQWHFGVFFKHYPSGLPSNKLQSSLYDCWKHCQVAQVLSQEFRTLLEKVFLVRQVLERFKCLFVITLFICKNVVNSVFPATQKWWAAGGSFLFQKSRACPCQSYCLSLGWHHVSSTGSLHHVLCSKSEWRLHNSSFFFLCNFSLWNIFTFLTHFLFDS